jgi:hypothetical protein
MYEHSFDGLTIPPAEAFSILERVVERLCEIVERETANPGRELALGALGYFMGVRDLIPDNQPGGLVDDLTMLLMALTEIDPASAGRFPRLSVGPGLPVSLPPELAEVRAKLRMVAGRVSSDAVTGHARQKLTSVREDLALVAARSPAGGSGAAASPDRTRTTNAAARLYFGMVLAAMWASRPRAAKGRQKPAPTGYRRAPRRSFAQAALPPPPIPDDELPGGSNPWEPSGPSSRSYAGGSMAFVAAVAGRVALVVGLVVLVWVLLDHSRVAVEIPGLATW